LLVALVLFNTPPSNKPMIPPTLEAVLLESRIVALLLSAPVKVPAANSPITPPTFVTPDNVSGVKAITPVDALVMAYASVPATL